MNRYVIETKQITKTYNPRSPFIALDHVDLHVSEGCIYGLIGDNGAGKSTLLKLLAGHIFPTNGELCLFGETEEKALCERRVYVFVGAFFVHIFKLEVLRDNNK